VENSPTAPVFSRLGEQPRQHDLRESRGEGWRSYCSDERTPMLGLASRGETHASGAQKIPAPVTAVILAAGEGTRMRGQGVVPKPLVELLGLTLLERVVLSLGEAGVQRFRIVVGDNRQAIVSAVTRSRRLRALDIEIVWCDASAGNGHSLAAGAAGLSEPFYLSMADHVFDPAIVSRLRAHAAVDPVRVHLATDANIGGVFDLDDATKVCTRSGAIHDIGKELADYDRVDVGLFYCPPWMSELATQAVSDGACSVSDVMHRAVACDAMRSCPIEPLTWQDVDTPAMLGEARRRLLDTARKPTDGPVARRFNRPISLATTRWLVRWGVSPNGATLMAFTAGLLGAALACSTSWPLLVAAAVLVQLGSVWDGCDGELARLTFRRTKFGAWLDTITDNVRILALVAGATVGVYRRSGQWAVLAVGGIAVFGAAVLYSVMNDYMRRTRAGGSQLAVLAAVEEERSSLRRNRFLRFLVSIRGLARQDVVLALAALSLAANVPHMIIIGTLLTVGAGLTVVLSTFAARRVERSGGALGWRPLFILVGFAVLVAVVSRFPLADIGAAVASMGWSVALTPLIAVVWFAAGTSGLRALTGPRVSWWTLFANRWMGEGYNAMVPLAGVAGEPVKVHHLASRTGGSAAVVAILLDKLINAASGLLFSAACVGTAVAVYSWPTNVELLATLYVIAAAAGGVALMWVARSRAPHRFGRWVLARLGRAQPIELNDRPGDVRLATAFGWHMLGRAAAMLEVAWLLYLLGLPVDALMIIAITGALSIAALFSVVIPQALGVSEGAAVVAFGLVGLPPTIGIAFGLARRARILGVGFAGIALHLSVTATTQPRARDAPEAPAPVTQRL
jgi:CDP-L-myo-inositol myo-inositolphosphotransferase